MSGEELLARAFCHEIDHLNGRLYISHVSALKRDLIRRKVRKLVKAGEWSLIFLGTPTFAVPTLERIVEAGHRVLAVFTQPDRPKGRGGQLSGIAGEGSRAAPGIAGPSTRADPQSRSGRAVAAA